MTWREWARPGIVEPSIYAADFARLGEQLESLLDAGARVFHFDIGDGHFIGEITIGPIVLRSISGLVHERGGVLDCHLMVSRARAALRERSGGRRRQRDVPCRGGRRSRRGRRAARVTSASASASPSTPRRRSSGGRGGGAAGADVALCMSIHPGLSGQAFMPDSLGRIEKLRSLVPDTVLVQVDGGVSAENAAEIREAGADLLVAGSAIFWQDDPAAAYLDLTAKVAEAVA